MNEFVDALRKAAEHDGYRKDIDCGATADYIERLKAGAQDNRDWAESAESEMKEAKGKLKVVVDALMRESEKCMSRSCLEAGPDYCVGCTRRAKVLKTIQGKGDGG